MYQESGVLSMSKGTWKGLLTSYSPGEVAVAPTFQFPNFYFLISPDCNFSICCCTWLRNSRGCAIV
jgi:hypothetical protein